jgi:hypothetical protein
MFVKYISDSFAARRADLTTRLTNPEDAYLLRWGAHCSADNSLNPDGCHLALQNMEPLVNVQSADLALSFKRIKGKS